MQRSNGERARYFAPSPLRSVTKQYALTVVVISVILSIALGICAWGLTAYFFSDVRNANIAITEIGSGKMVLQFAAAALFTAFYSWQQTIGLLRGRLRPVWLWLVVLLITLLILEAWIRQGFDLATVGFIVSFTAGYFTNWFVIARQVYTVKQRPRWPWEKKDPRESEILKLQEMWDRS